MERDFFYVQLKASDAARWVDGGRFVSVPVTEGDLQLWRGERVPVALVFYDAATDAAYWGHIQEMIEGVGHATVRLPMTQRFDEAAVETLRQRKNATA